MQDDGTQQTHVGRGDMHDGIVISAATANLP